MNLKTLTLFGFGQFHDQTFHLQAGFNVLLGPNEAGKSTITQFITAILFGFPTKKHPELRYEPLDGSRFGGAIEFEQDDVTYRVTRVDGPRGGKVTLQNLTTDLPLPASQLERLLAPVDAQLFMAVYALNESRLGTVFQASKQALIDRLRHVGAVGSDFWLDQAHALDQTSATRYKPQGRKPTLNQLLAEHAALTAKLTKANAAYQTYLTLREQQTANKRQQTELTTQLHQQRQVTTAKEHLLQAWPVYQQWQALQATPKVAASGFTQADMTTFERLSSQVKAAQTTLQTDQRQLQTLQAHTQLPKLFQAYLAVSDQVTPLFDDLAAVTARDQERNQLLTQKKDLEQRTNDYERQYADANGQMPQAFSLATTQKFKQLQSSLALATQKRHRLQQQLNQANETYRQLRPTRQRQNLLANKQVGWLIAGLVVLVGAMFLPGALIKLVGAAGGVAIGYYGVFIVDGETPVGRELQQLSTEIQDLQAQLREGGQRLDELTTQIDAIGTAHDLDRLPAEQWLAVQRAISDWERLTHQLDQVHQRLTTIDEAQHHFLTQVTTALPTLANQSVAAVVEQLTRLRTTQRQLASQNGELADLSGRLKRDQQALTTAQTARDTFLQTRNVATSGVFYQRYQAAREQGNQQAQRQALADQLGTKRLAQLQQTTQAQVTQDVATAKQTTTNLQHDLDAVTTHLATLAGQLEQLTTSGTQATLRQKLANLETRMQLTARDWLVDRLASQWIEATLEAASGDRFPQIVTQAGDFYAELTENRYTKIELTAATLRVQRADGQWRTVGQLSRGTAEQLDLAVKLAFAVVMQAQAAMPVVIDDGFVNFDAARRQAAYRLLNRVSQQLQVILLTADPAAGTAVADQRVLKLTAN